MRRNLSVSFAINPLMHLIEDALSRQQRLYPILAHDKIPDEDRRAKKDILPHLEAASAAGFR